MNSLPLEMLHMVSAYLDMPSLLSLRETSRAWYVLITDILAEEKADLLRPYVGDPGTLWDILADTHAVIA